jgi:integron integrase
MHILGGFSMAEKTISGDLAIPGKPGDRGKLLDRVESQLLESGFEKAQASRYVAWIRGYILFHDRQHPEKMGVPEIQQYLGSEHFRGAGGQEKRAEAERAIKFLYEQVLRRLWPRKGCQIPGDGARWQRKDEAAAKKEGAGVVARGRKVEDRGRYLNGTRQDIKLLDRVRNAMRVGQYALDTERAYVQWVKKYIFFHGVRHPQEMGALEVEQFLTHLAAERHVSAKTQKQALCALVFLYETVLGMELGRVMPVRGRHGMRLPVVMSPKEVSVVLIEIVGADGVFRLMCEVMYGSGLRIRECCRMRVHDVDLERLQLALRNGKGDHDRVTCLPRRLVEPLRRQIDRVRRWHERDLERGFGAVWLPRALRRKYPNAERELGWQYLFPSNRLSVDPREKKEGIKRRHHIHMSSVEKAVKSAVQRTGLTKRITCHTFRHSFATRLLETGHNVKTVQDLLGHKDIRTTMIYLHVMESGTTDVRSPLDLLDD